MNKPIFKVTCENTNKVYKIYEDGKVEGFGENIRIQNYIPSRMIDQENALKHDILLHLTKNLADTISEFGFTPENIYSNYDSTPFRSFGQLQGVKAYTLFTTLGSSKPYKDR